MTLILSWLSNKYVIQLSDRRLTKPTNGELYDEENNKAVSWRDDMIFSYCGLGFVDKKQVERTDDWIVSVLQKIKFKYLSDVPDVIAEEANKRFKTLPFTKKYKRHSFVGVGWGQAKGKRKFLPIGCVITNYHIEQKQILDEALDDFQKTSYTKSVKKYSCLLVNGVTPPTKDLISTRRDLEKCAKNDLSPIVAVGLLVRLARITADVSPEVGNSYMVSTLPRPDIRSLKGAFSLFMKPHRTIVTHFYIPSDQNKLIQYAPHYVCQGASMSHINIIKK